MINKITNHKCDLTKEELIEKAYNLSCELDAILEKEDTGEITMDESQKEYNRIHDLWIREITLNCQEFPSNWSLGNFKAVIESKQDLSSIKLI